MAGGQLEMEEKVSLELTTMEVGTTFRLQKESDESKKVSDKAIYETFSSFMTRIAKLDELVDAASKFLSGFQQALDFLRRPSIDTSHAVLERLLKANSTRQLSSYIEAGCFNSCDSKQNMSKSNGEDEIVLNPPAVKETRELRDIPATQRLNGKNYLKWAQIVKSYLKGRSLLKHVIGDHAPEEDDPEFEARDSEDSMIKTWLWCAMEPDISDNLVFLNTAKEVWDAVSRSYSKINDAAQIYEIKSKIAAIKQGNKSVNEVAGTLQGLWQQLDYLQETTLATVADFKKVIERDRIFLFLACLNPEYEPKRSQILGLTDLPSLEEVISAIRTEENRKNVMTERPSDEYSALVVKHNKHWNMNDKREKKETDASSKYSDKDDLFCTYCKKKRHTRENCWKLNGRGNTTGEKRVANLASKGESSTGGEKIPKIADFEKEDLERLRKLLNSLDETSSCSLAFTEVHACHLGLLDHIVRAKSVINELESFLGNAEEVVRATLEDLYPSQENDVDFLGSYTSPSSKEKVPPSVLQKPEVTDYAMLMGSVYWMVKKDYIMQERVVSALSLKSCLEELESYCLMWSLRPFVDDEIIRKAWNYV